MADDAIFINTSRGICLDEEALVAETGKGRIFAFLEVSVPAPALTLIISPASNSSTAESGPCTASEC